jgi:hypothetical protein
VDDETRRTLEELYDEIYDEQGNRTISLKDHLAERDDLQDWMKELLLEADMVEQWYGSRFIAIDPGAPYDDYRDMERFIRRVEDERLRDRLWDAIQGRGAFRRFKDTLARHPGLEDRWFEFKAAQTEQRMRDWLNANDIEPIA